MHVSISTRRRAVFDSVVSPKPLPLTVGQVALRLPLIPIAPRGLANATDDPHAAWSKVCATVAGRHASTNEVPAFNGVQPEVIAGFAHLPGQGLDTFP